MDETAPDGAVGHRVAAQRKPAGLTQQHQATRSHLDRAHRLIAAPEVR